MQGLSPRTWQLVQKIFPNDAEAAGRMLVEECGQNLPFCEEADEVELERFRFAALKISGGSLARLQDAVDLAKHDWRDELIQAGFAERVQVHNQWADGILGSG